jgi:multiple sugar transport system permease protein
MPAAPRELSGVDAGGPDLIDHIDTAISSRRASGFRRELPRLIGIMPVAALMALFFVAPAVWAISASLTDRALLGPGSATTEFIGLDNYRRLWNTPDFPMFVRNTVVFVIGSAVVGQTGLGLLLALLLDHARASRAILGSLAYAAVLVAWISPPTLAGAIWGAIFEYRHGALNDTLRAIGLAPVDMLTDHPMLAVIIDDVWRGTAFSRVIFLGALQTIPATIHEAARIDGANAWRRFRDHTAPLLTHIGAIVLMTTTITTMGAFLLILILTNGDPGYQTETLMLFAYHRAFSSYEIGFGAAISMVMLVLNLLFAAIYLRIARVTE